MTFNPTVEIVNGPVPDDHPSHKLRLDAALDLVERCKRQVARDNRSAPAKRQLADAEAALADVIANQPKGN